MKLEAIPVEAEHKKRSTPGRQEILKEGKEMVANEE